MPARVVALALTPVKGLRLLTREQILLEANGVREDRRFYLVDERGRMVNGKRCGELHGVIADYDHAARTLALIFPDGSVAEGPVQTGAQVETHFFSQPRPARLVEGPWAQELSRHMGQPLRLVEPVDAVTAIDRGAVGAASLISRASLDRLAQEASAPVDPRRFRMLIEVDGLEANAEDDWVGATLRIGAATVYFRGHVGRCLTTSRDPDSGDVDLPTLDLLGDYRREAETSEPLALGIYGEVVVPGSVRIGDPIAVAAPYARSL